MAILTEQPRPVHGWSTCLQKRSRLQPPRAAREVLSWLQRELRLPQLPLQIAERTGKGNCLEAVADIADEQVLLSIPATHWFIEEEMAQQLLLDMHACRSASAGNSGRLTRRQEGAARPYCPWLGSLPQAISLPHIHWQPEEVQALQDEQLVAEVKRMAAAHVDGWQALQATLQRLGFCRADYDWAAAVLHSRCFVFGPASRHVTLPVVDMANHSLHSNATINFIASPDECQGSQASQEVCEPAGPAAPSVFQLTATAGIRAGEEISISYGTWPNDVFLLLFGFVPGANPHDEVVLYDDLSQLCHESRAMAGEAEQLAEALGMEDTQRLVVTAQGLDARIAQVLPRLQLEQPGCMLAERCRALLSQSSSIAEDQQLLGAGGMTTSTTLAVQYRLHKKQLLHAAASALGSSPTAQPPQGTSMD